MGPAPRALARVALRREWRPVAVWAVSMLVLVVWSAVALDEFLGRGDSLQALMPMLLSPAAIAFTGPGYGSDHLTTGVLVAWQLLAYTTGAQAVMGVLLVVRQTRADEESGLGELVGSGAFRQRAPMAAALCAALVANVVVGAAVWAGLASLGLGVRDPLVFSLGGVMVGTLFAGLASVLVAVASSARAARGLGTGAVAAAFMLRGIGDVMETHGSWVSWTSPIGWAQQARPWADARWWPVLMGFAVAVVLGALGLVLAGRRDLGEGLVGQGVAGGASRRGPGGAWALAGWTQRASLAWWVVAGVVVGALYGAMTGAVVDSLSDLIGSNPLVAQYMGLEAGGATADGYMATITRYIGLLAAACAISLVAGLRREEASGRADAVLSTPTSRALWQVSTLAAVLAGTAVVLATAGLANGLASGWSTGDGSLVGPAVVAALAQWPAVAVCAALTLFLHAVGARVTGVAWGVFGVWMFLLVMGGVADLPGWLVGASPFDHVPVLPGAAPTAGDWVGVAAVVAVTLALAGAAVWRLSRRDLD